MAPKPITTDVIKLSTNIEKSCPDCDKWAEHGEGHFESSLNHQIEAHGRQLIHIGTETSRDDEGRLWSHTVAYLAAS